jgi:hypothetical protein
MLSILSRSLRGADAANCPRHLRGGFFDTARTDLHLPDQRDLNPADGGDECFPYRLDHSAAPMPQIVRAICVAGSSIPPGLIYICPISGT